MKEIPLTQGKVAYVSDHRFDELNQWKWYAHKSKNGTWYAMRNVGKFPFKTVIYMHRVIMGINDPKIQVDHQDLNGLNNQDENLRVCTKSQNMCNRGVTQKSTSGYKGVYFNKKRGIYQAYIKINKAHKYLGAYNNPVSAARAYDDAAKKYHGEFANLNQKEGE